MGLLSCHPVSSASRGLIMLQGAYFSERSESSRGPAGASVAEGLLEVSLHEGVEAGAEVPVPRDEAAALGGEARAALWPAARVALEELHAGGALEIAKVAPGRPVGHAHALDGLLEGSQSLDRFQQLGASFAEFHAAAEDHPELEPRTALERAAHRALAREDAPGGDGVVARAIHDHLAVDDDVGNARRMPMRIGKGRLVTDGLGIEERQIGREAGLDQAPVLEAELAGRHAGHLVHGRLPREEALLAAVDTEHARKGSVASRMRLA